MKKLIDEIFKTENEFKRYFKSVIGIMTGLRKFSKIVKTQSLWRSKERPRTNRPVFVEYLENNTCRLLFLSTKNYSKIKIDIRRECSVSKECNLNKMSYAFKEKGKFIFDGIPREIVDKYFKKCGVCKKNLDDFLKG
ncbi:hypothetical protein XO08_00625 [Thermosipho sp. 1074]|nr:hypothetical protein Y592_00620 [Thermosipho sp. 1070]OOC45569.1 hypothetical protein XO08_00625 [Thermosipho sp. 1074]